ncbi:MAG: TrmH family RNA methyltransferase [Bacteroidales bacterium]|nr:TrmH family RNA methyltransferase [Bacteroidales bacterium]
MDEHQLSFEEINKSHRKQISEIHKNRIPISVITDGINDIGNLGMIFRLADALRINKIYLYNLKGNFNFKLLKKKSRSTSNYVPYELINDFSQILNLKENYKFVVLDKTNKSVDFSEFIPEFPLCVIIGSEKFGVAEEMIQLADYSVHLPMFGVNTSINVATATSVILYDLVKKYQKNEKFYNK